MHERCLWGLYRCPIHGNTLVTGCKGKSEGRTSSKMGMVGLEQAFGRDGCLVLVECGKAALGPAALHRVLGRVGYEAAERFEWRERCAWTV